jgi:MYXO-CTERM domain-containing protein
VNTCTVATGTCATEDLKPLGCCNVDPDCNDGDPCTADTCTGPGGTCQHADVPTCCVPGDPRIGSPCDPPQSPYDQPPCTAGTIACNGGQLECVGSIGPSGEVCDGSDNDCNGIVDMPVTCPRDGQICLWGNCVGPCSDADPRCPEGFACFDGWCVPTDCGTVVCPDGRRCVDGICGGAGAGGAGGAAGSGGSGTGAAGGDGGAQGSAGTAAAGPKNDATDEGGCACGIVGGDDGTRREAWLAACALALVISLRRRHERA